MAKYRKTALVEAVQWNFHGDHPAVRCTSYMEISDMLGTSGCYRDAPYWTWNVMGVIETLEGKHVVIPGDWIATGVKGEHWPIKDDIFKATYELAED